MDYGGDWTRPYVPKEGCRVSSRALPMLVFLELHSVDESIFKFEEFGEASPCSSEEL
jgi:hypothetical protein